MNNLFENVKKTFKELCEYMPQHKRQYFNCLSLFLIPITYIVIKNCDIPIFRVVPDWIAPLLIKKPNSDMLLYNIGVSYVVSYIFYLFVNFIPEYLSYKEKAIEKINLRCAIHREIQLFTIRVLTLWVDIVKEGIENDKTNQMEFKGIEEIFNIDTLKSATEGVWLSNQSNTITVNGQYLDWQTKILSEINSTVQASNQILTRYKSDIPSNIYYDIFYLINESSILGCLIKILGCINGKNTPLSSCIGFNTETGVHIIKESCNCIIELYNWVNIEYSLLKMKTNEKRISIYNIDMKQYVEARSK